MKTSEKLGVALIIDVNSIANVTRDDQKLSLKEIMELWDTEAVFYYNSHNGNPPRVVGDKSVARTIDVNLLKGDLV